MRKSFLWIVAVVVGAMPLQAAGEYFPRDIFGYAELQSAAELRDFIDITNLSALDFGQRQDDESFAQFKRVLSVVMEDLRSVEVAVLGLEFGRGDPMPQIVAHMTYSRNLDLQEFIEQLAQEDIEEGKQIQTMDFAGFKYMKLGDSEDAPYVGVAGMNALIAMRESHFKDMADAYQGSIAAEELLTANARFMAWRAATAGDGAVRGWVDATKIRGYIERGIAGGKTYDYYDEKVPDGDQTPEEREERRKQQAELRKKRQEERNNRDLARLEASRAFEWDSVDTISLSFGLSEGARVKATANFKQPLSFAAALPAPATFTSFKYLPESTLLAGGFALPNARTVGNTIVERLREARRLYLAKSGEQFADRDAFGNRLQPVDRLLRNFRELLTIGGVRLSHSLMAAGVTEPWSGSAEDLAKLLDDQSLRATFCSYKIESVLDLQFVEDGGYASGVIFLTSPLGPKATLDLGEKELSFDRGPDNGIEGKTMTLADVADGVMNVLEFAAGFTLNEFSGLLGSHVVIGMAVDTTSAAMGERARIGDGEGVFGIIPISDMAKLESRLTKLAVFFPQEIRDYILTANGDRFQTRFEYKGARFLFGNGEFALVVTEDSILLGRPSVVAQMLSDKRPARIAQSSGLAPIGSAVFVADFKQFNDNPVLSKLPYHRVNDDVRVDFVLFASATLTANSFTVECNQPFSKARDFGQIDSRWNSSKERDSEALADLYRIADQIFEERLADDNEDNDLFPTIGDTIAALKAQRAARGEEEYDEYWNLRDDFERSRIFSGSLDQNWEFFDSRRPVAQLLDCGSQIVAISRPDKNGRRYVAAGWELFSVSEEIYQRMLEIRDEAIESEHDVIIERHREFMLDRLEAALLLEPLWEQRMLNDLRRRYSGMTPEEGEAINLPRYGVARFIVVSESVTKLRIEGFGHWALYDSQFGLTDASWLKEETKD